MGITGGDTENQIGKCEAKLCIILVIASLFWILDALLTSSLKPWVMLVYLMRM
jgi:hypothetical protein